MNTLRRTNRCDSPLAKAGQRGGFSLVELLAVVSIMVIVMTLAIPVMHSLNGAGDVSKAVYEIKGILDHARTCAMANNTYVWVGFFEEDGSRSSTTPATPGIGRVTIAAVASRNGTRGYDTANPPEYLDSANLAPIDKLQKFDGLHLATLNGYSNQGAIPSTGGMARPRIKSNNYDLGNAACAATARFSWPVTASSQPDAHYPFAKIINFDPQGAARIQYASNADFLPLYIEIGLQSAQGNIAPPSPPDQTKGKHSAIQIDGMTGATRVYRP
ncbi:MAG: prepilin-type N-terminal cleavage/methylation domain-containing protein [Verrucomicrobiota bacterium]